MFHKICCLHFLTYMIFIVRKSMKTNNFVFILYLKIQKMIYDFKMVLLLPSLFYSGGFSVDNILDFRFFSVIMMISHTTQTFASYHTNKRKSFQLRIFVSYRIWLISPPHLVLFFHFIFLCVSLVYFSFISCPSFIIIS